MFLTLPQSNFTAVTEPWTTRLYKNRMKTLFLLLFLGHVSSAVRHTGEIFSAGISGLSNLPEFGGGVTLSGILLGTCDTNKNTIEIKQDWLKPFLENNTQELELYNIMCLQRGPNIFKAKISSLKQLFDQSGGVHVLQRISGCEWDDESGEANCFLKYGYDGEDFIALDPKTVTWNALNPLAVTIKENWIGENAKKEHLFLTQTFLELVKKYVTSFKRYLLRTELPSVSLLQKTPSSPVSCHATGFYPDRATLIWRKDGEEVHENVEHGEILPNHDGTFQMSVDLDVSSVTPEDWRRYDCVFQLSGVKEDIVTKLVKDQIRTNWEKPSNMISITTAVLVLFICLITVTGFIIHKKRKAAGDPANSADNGSELSQRLKAGT